MRFLIATILGLSLVGCSNNTIESNSTMQDGIMTTETKIKTFWGIQTCKTQIYTMLGVTTSKCD